MRFTLSWLAAVGLALLPMACDDTPSDVSGGADAAVGGGADANPNAPEADPNAPDADPTAPDAMPTGGDIDASPSGTPGEIMCGDATCTSPEVCCVMGGGPGASASCTAADACTGTPAACDGPEDCDSGESCCGSFSGSHCGTTDSCQAVVCHTNTDCPTAGDMCCEMCSIGP